MPSRQRFLEWGVAIGAVVAFFYRAVFSADIFIGRDIQRVYYPLRAYWAERVSSGQWPDWYPYDGLGQPFAGMMISTPFHPTNALLLLLSAGAAMKLTVLGAYAFALVGAHRLARAFHGSEATSLLTAVLFAFNGYLVGLSDNLPYLLAAAAIPWALAGAVTLFAAPEPRSLCATALMLALVLLAGDPESFVLCALGCAAIAVASRARRRARWLIALGLTTVPLVIAQGVAAAHVLASGAPGTNSWATASMWSAHPLRVLELALGPLFLDERREQIQSAAVAAGLLRTGTDAEWAGSVHFGLWPLALAALATWSARRSRWGRWAIGGFAVVFLLWLGRFAGLYRLLFELLPFWRAFRYPEKLFPWVALLLALGAAAGAESLSSVATRRRFALVLGAGTLLCGALAIAESSSGLLTRWMWSSPRPEDAARLSSNLVRCAIESAISLGAAGVAVALIQRARGRNLVLAALAFLHLFVTGRSLYMVTDPDVLTDVPDLAKEIFRREGMPALGRFRIASSARSFPRVTAPDVTAADYLSLEIAASLGPCQPALWGLESSTIYLPAFSPRVAGLDRRPDVYGPLYGTRYEVLPESAVEARGANVERLTGVPALKLALVRNTKETPRVFLARPRCVRGDEQARQRIEGDSMAIGDATVQCPPGAPDGVAPHGTVTGEMSSPEHWAIDASSDAPALLVVNDAYYPGWRATIDGTDASIVPANLGVRGIWMPSGRHRVELSYRTPFLRLAIVINALAGLCALGVALFGWKRRRART